MGSEKAQQMKVLIVKTDNLSWIPRAYVVEGKNQPLQVVLWPPMHDPTYTHIR